MTADFLEKILIHKKELNQSKKVLYQNIKDKMDGVKHTHYHLFRQHISKSGQLNLIAEIKKASPSKGLLREDFDFHQIAKTYVKHQAAAISVLTEEKYFLGNPLYIRKLSEDITVPLLTKDFIIEEGQIYEALANGASAILLIVAILTEDQLKHLYQLANSLALDCLVEVHSEEELKVALNIDADIIGINHRDLKTFNVDFQLSESLVPKIPEGKIIVAESGIASHADILRLEKLGVHAVLIGETFMKAEDIGSKVDEVMGRINH